MLNAQTLINPDIISTDTVNEKFFPSLLLVLERMMILLEEPEHEMAPELPLQYRKRNLMLPLRNSKLKHLIYW